MGVGINPSPSFGISSETPNETKPHSQPTNIQYTQQVQMWIFYSKSSPRETPGSNGSSKEEWVNKVNQENGLVCYALICVRTLRIKRTRAIQTIFEGIRFVLCGVMEKHLYAFLFWVLNRRKAGEKRHLTAPRVLLVYIYMNDEHISASIFGLVMLSGYVYSNVAPDQICVLHDHISRECALKTHVKFLWTAFSDNFFFCGI